MTTAVSESVVTVSTGTKGTGMSSTIARFSDRAIMPSTVRITGVPGWAVSTKALIPSMLASESGSGLTCDTTTTRRNRDSTASNRSERVSLANSGSDTDSVLWGSAVIVGLVPGARAVHAHHLLSNGPTGWIA